MAPNWNQLRDPASRRRFAKGSEAATHPHASPLIDHVPNWQKAIWLGCAIGLMLMITSLVILVAAMLAKVMDLLQFRPPDLAVATPTVNIPTTATINVPTALAASASAHRPSDSEYSFIFTGLALVNSSLLRLLAILIGGAIAFVGLAVSFFVHQKATSLDAGAEKGAQQKATVALATNSPGLVAVVIGAAVIIVAVVTKTTHTFAPGASSGQGVALPRTLPPRSELPLPADDGPSVPEKIAR